jgi:hypothetical protein
MERANLKRYQSSNKDMKVVKITADVYCAKPNAIYRLYVDNDLLTERSVHWNPTTHYVRENIIVQIQKNAQHNIRLEAVMVDQGFFALKNIVVDGRKTNDTFIV